MTQWTDSEAAARAWLRRLGWTLHDQDDGRVRIESGGSQLMVVDANGVLRRGVFQSGWEAARLMGRRVEE